MKVKDDIPIGQWIKHLKIISEAVPTSNGHRRVHVECRCGGKHIALWRYVKVGVARLCLTCVPNRAWKPREPDKEPIEGGYENGSFVLKSERLLDAYFEAVDDPTIPATERLELLTQARTELWAKKKRRSRKK